jgi:hypothetical protein
MTEARSASSDDSVVTKQSLNRCGLTCRPKAWVVSLTAIVKNAFDCSAESVPDTQSRSPNGRNGFLEFRPLVCSHRKGRTWTR